MMAGASLSETIKYPDKNMNKVYINPNFRNADRTLTNNSLMYVHPKFSNVMTNAHNLNEFNTKIYVNPNFVRNNNAYDQPLIINNKLDTENANNSISQELKSSIPGQISSDTIKPVPIAKSRYRLIRQNETKLMTNTIKGTLKNMIKISKHKLVPLNDIKRNLMTKTSNIITSRAKTSNQTESGIVVHKLKNCSISSLSNAYESRFKFIKQNTESIKREPETKYTTSRKSSTHLIRKNSKEDYKIRKITKINLRKNNIPCPLYRKYGKCMRNAHGNCHFSHDKKHVSICQRFLKGICHDKECLLSHDLTVKKMPTCYFYLQGICTKEDCPYLHVKLNEKSEICKDFLKGYCEKGNKCLCRHINICPDLAEKGSCVRKQCPYPHNRNKTKSPTKNKTKCFDKDVRHIDQKKKPLKNDSGQNEDPNDCRYYEEVVTNETVSDPYAIIKPSRCKLGILPAFIQL